MVNYREIPKQLDAINPRMEPDYSYIHRELARSGVNLTLLRTEYDTGCQEHGVSGTNVE